MLARISSEKHGNVKSQEIRLLLYRVGGNAKVWGSTIFGEFCFGTSLSGCTGHVVSLELSRECSQAYLVVSKQMKWMAF